jgi:hypothetical protein
VSARIRGGSRFKRFLFFVLMKVQCFLVPQVEDHCSTQYNYSPVSPPKYLNSYRKASLCVMYMRTTVSSPCCCSTHSVTSLLVSKWRFRVTERKHFTVSTWKVRRILWHTFQDVLRNRKFLDMQSFINLDR